MTDTERLNWLESKLNSITFRRQRNGTIQLALNPSINYEYDLYNSFREAIDKQIINERSRIIKQI